MEIARNIVSQKPCLVSHLFVKNLAIRCEEGHLREALQGCEGLERVEVKYDAKLVGFAFVSFGTLEQTQIALSELNDRKILGRKLRLARFTCVFCWFT